MKKKHLWILLPASSFMLFGESFSKQWPVSITIALLFVAAYFTYITMDKLTKL
jgi:hypothetical protein